MTIDLRDQLLEFCAVIEDEQGPITVDDVQGRNDTVIPTERAIRPMVSVRRGWTQVPYEQATLGTGPRMHGLTETDSGLVAVGAGGDHDTKDAEIWLWND